jgi:hypothetical protein
MDDEIKQIEANIQKLSCSTSSTNDSISKELRRIALKMIECAFSQYVVHGIKTTDFVTGNTTNKGGFQDSHVSIRENRTSVRELLKTKVFIGPNEHNQIAAIIKDIIREKELKAKSSNGSYSGTKHMYIDITIL